MADSAGNITIDPSSGPVESPVAVEIRLFPATPQQYTLEATSTDAAQGGCSSARPIPGVGAVTVGPQGGFVNFNWPDAFASGQYWLCASPQSGTGPTAQSLQPYTVTAGAAATATPGSGGDTSPVSVAAIVPSGGAPAGSSVTVVVTGWATPDNVPPTTLKLVPYTNASAATSLPFVVAASPAPGDFNLKVTLPVTTAPGRYAFEVGGAYHIQTTFVDVIAPVTPTAPAGLPGSPGPGTTSESGGVLATALAVGIAVLLLLAGAVLLASALGHKREAAEWHAPGLHDANRRQHREDAMRR